MIKAFKKQFIPYGKQKITNDDIEAVTNTLKSEYLTQGPVGEIFEAKISKKVNSSYAVTFNSATSALHASCLALGVGNNDYVWTSPNTFVASANCARLCGAQIDFIDINPLNGLISIEKLEKKLKSAKASNKLPKVLIPVHLCGSSCDMKKIFKLSKIYNFSIIEDASHALGGRYEDEPVGNCKYSDICVFSLHPVKIITSGEGGIATTNQAQLSKKLRNFRSHGITKDDSDFEKKSLGPWYYEMQNLGLNYRLTDIQAALGISQLKRLDSIIKKRNDLVKEYKKLTEGFPIEFLKVPDNVYSSFHLAVIRLHEKSSLHHLKIFTKLRDSGIGVQLHYLPVHLHPYYRKLGFKEGDFPESEFYSSNAFSIPLFEDLTKAVQQKIINSLEKALFNGYD